MSRRIQLVGIVAVALALGACGGSGGSKHSSTTTTAAPAAASGGVSPGPSASAVPTTPGGSSAPATRRGARRHNHARSAAASAQPAAPRPGGVTAKRAASHDGGAAISPGASSPSAPGSGSAGGGTRNAPQQETFTVSPGGTLKPTSMSLPAVPSIELRVISQDRRSRRILLRTASPQTLTVPANGKASVLVTGLAPGRYVLDVDGLARGALFVGG